MVASLTIQRHLLSKCFGNRTGLFGGQGKGLRGSAVVLLVAGRQGAGNRNQETMRVEQLHSLTGKALGEGEGAVWQRRGRQSPSTALWPHQTELQVYKISKGRHPYMVMCWMEIGS